LAVGRTGAVNGEPAVNCQLSTVNKPAMSRYQAIYAVVRRIPRGRVATYGQIATLAGLDGHARQVGYALHALPSGSGLPWHRVVNSYGEVSRRSDSDSDELQIELLHAEGVVFDLDGRIDLRRFRWRVRRRTGRTG